MPDARARPLLADKGKFIPSGLPKLSLKLFELDNRPAPPWDHKKISKKDGLFFGTYLFDATGPFNGSRNSFQ